MASALNSLVTEAYQESDGTTLPLGRRMSAENIAKALEEKLPSCEVLNLDPQVDDELEDITEELAVEDIQDTWTGLLDTSAPAPKTAKPEATLPMSNLVCDAITELSSSLNEIEEKFKQNISVDDKEITGHVDEIRSDVGQFIQMLSQKLSEKEEILKDKEKSKKDQLLEAEAERLEQLELEKEKQEVEQKRKEEKERLELAAEEAARKEAQ